MAAFQVWSSSPPSERQWRRIAEDLWTSQKSDIKNTVAGKNTFSIVDETQISGKKYLHEFLGLLENAEYSKLVGCRVMDEVNAKSVTQAIDDVMKEFEVDRTNFLLLTSDAAA